MMIRHDNELCVLSRCIVPEMRQYDATGGVDRSFAALGQAERSRDELKAKLALQSLTNRKRTM